MSRFYFHLCDAGGRLVDHEGVAIAAEAIDARALEAARELIAADIRNGRLDLNSRIEVEDGNGVIVHTRSFASAVDLAPPAPDPVIEVRLV